MAKKNSNYDDQMKELTLKGMIENLQGNVKELTTVVQTYMQNNAAEPPTPVIEMPELDLTPITNAISTIKEEFASVKKPIETIHAHLNAMGTQRTTSLASEPQATPKRAIISVSGDSVTISSIVIAALMTIVFFSFIVQTNYTSSTVWANRAYEAAVHLGRKAPGDEYDLVTTAWYEGRRKEMRGHVRDMEEKWDAEKRHRGAVKYRLDSLLMINSTVDLFEQRGSALDEIQFFCTFRDSRDTTTRAAWFDRDNLWWTYDTRVRSFDDAYIYRRSPKHWEKIKGRMW